MRLVIQTLYREPVYFLGAAQLGLTAAAAEGAITGWIPTASLAFVLYLQRRFVTPTKGQA